jgi:hypothetical protein
LRGFEWVANLFKATLKLPLDSIPDKLLFGSSGLPQIRGQK